MAEYIEREKVRKLMRKYGFRAEDMTINEFVEDVLPAADVAPVVEAEYQTRRAELLHAKLLRVYDLLFDMYVRTDLKEQTKEDNDNG